MILIQCYYLFPNLDFKLFFSFFNLMCQSCLNRYNSMINRSTVAHLFAICFIPRRPWQGRELLILNKKEFYLLIFYGLTIWATRHVSAARKIEVSELNIQSWSCQDGCTSPRRRSENTPPLTDVIRSHLHGGTPNWRPECCK